MKIQAQPMMSLFMSQLVPMRQRGVSLIFAMLTIGVLSLSAVALIRSIDSGTLILGNLGFKQDTQLAAEDGGRTALRWLSQNIASTTLYEDIAAQGYYATTRVPLDPTGNNLASLGNTRNIIDWNRDSCAGVTSTTYASCLRPSDEVSIPLANSDIAGVSVRYVILRLCSGTGNPNGAGATIHCAKPLTALTDEGSDRSGLTYSKYDRLGSTGVPQYFRIVVRAAGRRQTVTYTEILAHF